VERSGLFHGLNLNKKSVTLNLGHPEAQALAREIVRRCDIVIENFSYGQMEKFNLGYEQLKAVRPDLIMVSSSGLGRWGPYREYVTYGPPLTAYTGLASVTGQDGGLPERWIGGLWSDHQAGLTSLFGVLAALEHRERTGEGQLVEYSMAETITGQLPEAFIQYGLEGTVPGPSGNRDRGMCPHGIYRAADDDDRWIALAVQTDEDWRRLRAIVPGPGWWHDPALEHLDRRMARAAEIDAVLAAWARSRTADESVEALRAAGLAAGAVAKVDDLLADQNLRRRGFFLATEHPEVGTRTLAGLGWTMPCIASMPVRPAPLLGEHNWEVFTEWLGLTPEQFSDLVDRGVIC
jgi:crotonobetainyl-CoA:carnitine CoA-transferase CaiB-like acyl-CoA transferase